MEVEEKEWLSIVEISEAIIEKIDKGLQIQISVIGAINAKCSIINELLTWFEKHDLFASKNSERFTICIPQAVDFNASKDSISDIVISIKQPI